MSNKNSTVQVQKHIQKSTKNRRTSKYIPTGRFQNRINHESCLQQKGSQYRITPIAIEQIH